MIKTVVLGEGWYIEWDTHAIADSCELFRNNGPCLFMGSYDACHREYLRLRSAELASR